MFKTFSYSQTLWQKFHHIYSQKLYRCIVAPNANFYLKPNDIISLRPTLLGYHEPHLEKLIKNLTPKYGDFLLDLGANVGLTSALVGKNFKTIDCVEPNEIVVNILKSNLALNIPKSNYQIHQIALGTKNETLNLTIPTDNFGGAFLNNKQNNKNNDRKPFPISKKSTQIKTKVKVKSAQIWMKNYFATISKLKYKKGIIKIDVEGYETPIIKAIIQNLPKNMSIVMITENWFKQFKPENYPATHHDINWFYIHKKKRYLHSIPFKLLGLSSSYKHELRPLTSQTNSPTTSSAKSQAKPKNPQPHDTPPSPTLPRPKP